MKKQTLFIAALIISISMMAQDTGKSNAPALKDLAVPNAPAFLLLDAAPSNIESPVNPKEFTLGLVQNFDLDNKWINDYSMEFTPYWWAKPGKRSAYSFMGLEKVKDSVTYKQNYFSGFQFTSVSLAFLNRDMIPDTLKLNQKIFSLGIRTTVLKIRNSNYCTTLNVKLKEWHEKAQVALENFNNQIALHPDKIDSLSKALANDKNSGFSLVSDEIKQIIEQKPLFNWELAGAFSEYGIGDSIWKTGRAGCWTTISSYIPLSKTIDNNNYVDLLVSARYIHDNYIVKENNTIAASATFDIGGKLGIEIGHFSLFAEGMYRKVSVNTSWESKLVGGLNYQVQDALYFSGTYGKDFGPGKKIIALFGINWGFGSEKVAVKDAE